MPRFLRNYELEHYPGPFPEPFRIENGLAVYAEGEGAPILVFPYPHAHTEVPMIADALAETFRALGRRTLSFDPPGAFRSRREPKADMPEMLGCARETLAACGESRVDVAGHSMGSLCALAFAIEYPDLVNRLILVGSMTGFPAAIRWGMPGSVWKWSQLEYWRLMGWGIRLMFGRGNLSLHKRYVNLMNAPCYHDPSFFQPLPVKAEDRRCGVPARYRWSHNLWRRVDYSQRLGAVKAPTLICVGRHDPETPPPCSEELKAGISGARMVVFEESGHAPFVEERARFIGEVQEFFASQGGS